jgi:hypothetical protein
MQIQFKLNIKLNSQPSIDSESEKKHSPETNHLETLKPEPTFY